MPKRTQIVCMHEGEAGHSVDPIFVRVLLRALDPGWIRPFGSNTVRFVPCGGRAEMIGKFMGELDVCAKQGAETTLVVLADLDHDMPDGNALKERFRQKIKDMPDLLNGFDRVVFAFPKDRIENWIEYLSTGATDENREGPRVDLSDARKAAEKLAEMCKRGTAADLPLSLEWSCTNWRALVERMTG